MSKNCCNKKNIVYNSSCTERKKDFQTLKKTLKKVKKSVAIQKRIVYNNTCTERKEFKHKKQKKLLKKKSKKV